MLRVTDWQLEKRPRLQFLQPACLLRKPGQSPPRGHSHAGPTYRRWDPHGPRGRQRFRPPRVPQMGWCPSCRGGLVSQSRLPRVQTPSTFSPCRSAMPQPLEPLVLRGPRTTSTGLLPGCGPPGALNTACTHCPSVVLVAQLEHCPWSVLCGQPQAPVAGTRAWSASDGWTGAAALTCSQTVTRRPKLGAQVWEGGPAPGQLLNSSVPPAAFHKRLLGGCGHGDRESCAQGSGGEAVPGCVASWPGVGREQPWGWRVVLGSGLCPRDDLRQHTLAAADPTLHSSWRRSHSRLPKKNDSQPVARPGQQQVEGLPRLGVDAGRVPPSAAATQHRPLRVWGHLLHPTPGEKDHLGNRSPQGEWGATPKARPPGGALLCAFRKRIFSPLIKTKLL